MTNIEKFLTPFPMTKTYNKKLITGFIIAGMIVCVSAFFFLHNSKSLQGFLQATTMEESTTKLTYEKIRNIKTGENITIPVSITEIDPEDNITTIGMKFTNIPEFLSLPTWNEKGLSIGKTINSVGCTKSLCEVFIIFGEQVTTPGDILDVVFNIESPEQIVSSPMFVQFKLMNSDGEKASTMDYVWFVAPSTAITLDITESIPTIEDNIISTPISINGINAEDPVKGFSLFFSNLPSYITEVELEKDARISSAMGNTSFTVNHTNPESNKIDLGVTLNEDGLLGNIKFHTENDTTLTSEQINIDAQLVLDSVQTFYFTPQKTLTFGETQESNESSSDDSSESSSEDTSSSEDSSQDNSSSQDSSSSESSSVNSSIEPTINTADINQDGTVGIADLSSLMSAWNTVNGDTDYDTNADINSDEKVDIKDFAKLLIGWDPNTDLAYQCDDFDCLIAMAEDCTPTVAKLEVNRKMFLYLEQHEITYEIKKKTFVSFL